MREIDEGEKALHDLINQAEDLARNIRVVSHGYLSLAVVNNHGRTLREREGMGWQAAQEAAERVYRAPDSVTAAVLDDAVRVYAAERGERPSMIAALTAVNLFEPEYLDTALKAYRHGYHGSVDSMRHALVAVIELRREHYHADPEQRS